MLPADRRVRARARLRPRGAVVRRGRGVQPAARHPLRQRRLPRPLRRRAVLARRLGGRRARADRRARRADREAPGVALGRGRPAGRAAAAPGPDRRGARAVRRRRARPARAARPRGGGAGPRRRRGARATRPQRLLRTAAAPMARAGALELLVRACAAEGDGAAAARHAAELRAIADALPTAPVRAAASYARAWRPPRRATTHGAGPPRRGGRGLRGQRGAARDRRARLGLAEALAGARPRGGGAPRGGGGRRGAATRSARRPRAGARRRSRGGSARRRAGELSAREVEVLRLVADGLGDRQIAAAAHAQRAHRAPPRGEHPREAALLVARGRGRARAPPRPALSGRSGPSRAAARKMARAGEARRARGRASVSTHDRCADGPQAGPSARCGRPATTPRSRRSSPRSASASSRASASRPGAAVLDVACGTGNVAIPAALAGARVTGVDLTPEHFPAARARAAAAGVEVDWVEGDVEALPFEDDAFDVVLSAFGCMFAPRHAVAAAELARVLRPAGGSGSRVHARRRGRRLLPTLGALAPPPPAFAENPLDWGEPAHVRSLFGDLDLRVRARVLLRALRVARRRGRALHDDVRADRGARRPGAAPATCGRCSSATRSTAGRADPLRLPRHAWWRVGSPTAPGAARPA